MSNFSKQEKSLSAHTLRCGCGPLWRKRTLPFIDSSSKQINLDKDDKSWMKHTCSYSWEKRAKYILTNKLEGLTITDDETKEVKLKAYVLLYDIIKKIMI